MTANTATIASGSFIAALIVSALAYAFYLLALRKSTQEVQVSGDRIDLERVERLLTRCARAGLAVAVVWIAALSTTILALRLRGFGEGLQSTSRAVFPFLVLAVPVVCWMLYIHAVLSVERTQAISESRKIRRASTLKISWLLIGIPLIGASFVLPLERSYGFGPITVVGLATFLLWTHLMWSRATLSMILTRPLEDGRLRERLGELVQRTGINVCEILMIEDQDDNDPEAIGVGFGRSRRVLLTSSLVSSLNENQVAAIVAHEVAHLVNQHLLKRPLFLLGVFGLIVLLDSALSAAGAPLPLQAVSLCASIPALILAVRWYERHTENRADDLAAALTDPLDLATALATLPENSPPPRWMPRSLMRALATHPERGKRVERLRAMAKASVVG